MSTKVVINESPQYKLSVTDGTDQTLSVTNGIELQVTANVGGQGPAGPNEITTSTSTNLTGFIYGDGTNIGGAAEAVYAGENYDEYYGKLARYGFDDAFLWTPNTIAFGLGPQYTEDDQFSTLTSLYVGHSWNMPNASGTIALSNAPQTFTGAFEISNSSVKLSQIPTFSDNAAASSLAAGSVYKTSTGELRIKY